MLSSLLSWVKANPYKVVGIVAVFDLVALGAAFAAGRYTVPERVITQTLTQEVVREVVKTEIQVVEKKIYVKDEKRDVRTETTTIEKPDGTRETRVVEVDRTQTQEASSQESNIKQVVMVEKEKLVYVDKLTITEAQKAQWHLGLRLGAGATFLPGLKPLVSIGLQAERRILGPVWAGLWIDGQLPASYPPTPPYTLVGGLVVGIEL